MLFHYQYFSQNISLYSPDFVLIDKYSSKTTHFSNSKFLKIYTCIGHTSCVLPRIPSRDFISLGLSSTFAELAPLFGLQELLPSGHGNCFSEWPPRSAVPCEMSQDFHRSASFLATLPFILSTFFLLRSQHINLCLSFAF